MAHATFEAARSGGAALLGGWITSGEEGIVETMFSQGYDYVGIDTQHTLLDVPMAGRLLHAVPKGGPAAVIRVPSNNANDIGKAFDAGADGVIVPMVNSGDEARAAVAAARYAPEGVRSFGPMRAGTPYDVAALTARTAIFVMVETVEAVGNIEDICATPGLTGVYVGPADLSITLGLRVGVHPMPDLLMAALTKVGAACQAAGIIAGGHFNSRQAPFLTPLGFRMFTIGVDRGYIAMGARADIEEGRKAAG
jgi:2-keto-3-deoxy-L-rhamnonate aldolase RhmA